MRPMPDVLPRRYPCVKNGQQETLPKWKAIGRPTPSPVGWDATHELLMVLLKVPYSSFSGPTHLFPRLFCFFFHIPSLSKTRGTQLEPTSAFLFLFFSLYRQCIDIQLKENRNAVWIFHHVVKDRTDWCQLERNGSVFLRAKTCFCGAASHRRMGEREGDW